MNKKVACFIHRNGNIHLNEIAKTIANSRLIDGLDFVFINNIGEPLRENDFKKIHPKFIVQSSSSSSSNDVSTIQLLHSFSKIHPDYKILYMDVKEGIQSWLEYLMCCLIENAETCIDYLEIYDTIGTNYSRRRYLGNCWWANASYISTLDVLSNNSAAEFWLLQNQKARWYNLYNLDRQEYPKLNYNENVKTRIQENLLFCKFGTSGIGLCNQLYSLVNTMVIGSVLKGNTLIVVDDFMGDLNSNQYHDAATILDLPRINTMYHGVTLVSKHAIRMEVTKIEYGLSHMNQVVDITDKIVDRFYTKNRLFIPRGTSINSILGFDPCPDKIKQLYITYSLNNGTTFHDTRDEIRLLHDEDVDIDFVNLDKRLDDWLSLTSITDCKKETATFNYFLNHIYFNPIYENYAAAFLDTAIVNSKVNVIHLRLEEDAIPFWSSINGISCEEYEKALIEQYIRAIQEHIDPTDSVTILLSMNTCNAVTKWMTENKYQMVQNTNKGLVVGREVNAIIDLIISAQCNNVFIGNLNPHNYHGSTFSYAIFNSLRNKPVIKVCIDNDDIYHPFYVVV